MGEPIPRYSFDPLERRGLLFGLQPSQIALSGACLLFAWVLLRAVPPPVGPSLALAWAIGGSAAAFLCRDGQTAASWGVSGFRWAARRLHGPVLSDAPLDGTRGRSTVLPSKRRYGRSPCPEGIELIELPPQAGEPSVGVMIDRIARHWIAVVPARGSAFALLDPEDQARRLDSWRVALNSLGRPGTPIRRVQWIERTSPAEVQNSRRGIHPFPSSEPSSGAVESYLEVTAGTGAGSQPHEVWLVLAVEGPDSRSGHSRARAADTVRRELRLVEGQLRNAELFTSGPLDGSALADTLRIAHSAGSGTSRSRALQSFRPMADEEGWSVFRTDGTWHATYWIAEWPRIDVGPDFMSPLLMSGGRRAVSLVMAPVPPDRASRDVRSARTSDAAEEHLRANAGFTPSARRSRQAEAAMRREEELADGHAEFRFSGYVTVSALNRAALEVACAETEHAAQAAHLQIRRLYGRQREAFTWTLPLARGVS